MTTRNGTTRTAVLYARVSTDEQATSGYSLRQQLEALRGWCEREGCEVLEEVVDPGHSGAYLERPGLDRVRDLVQAGGVSVVVAQDADRITRDPIHRALLDEEMERFGTRLMALDDWGDDSHEGELLRYMKGWVSKGERLKTAERTRRGLNRKVAEGKVIRGNKAPIGFAYADDGNALVVSEPEMAVVRRIFRWVGAEGLSIGECERRLEAEGIPSPTGGHWHRPSIRNILLSELYRPLLVEEVASSGLVPPEVARTLDEERVYGLWTWNKRSVRRWKERGDDGEIRDRVRNEARPREQWSAVPVDLSDAGLTRSVVDAAAERVGQNVRHPPSTRARRYWELSGGMIRCEICGNAFSPHTSRQRGKYRTYYRCYTRYNSGLKDCTNRKCVRAVELEESVWKAVRALLSDPDWAMSEYDAYVERRKAQLRGDPDREAREMTERLQKLERRRSGYLDLAADGDMSREDLRHKLSEVDEQADALRKALEEARDRQETISKLRRDREMVFGRFSTMRAMDLRTLAPENRRKLYQALRLRVEVDENGDARISGVFDADIAELLPMAQAPEGKPYVVHSRREIPPPYKGVVTLDSAGARAGARTRARLGRTWRLHRLLSPKVERPL